MRYIFLLLLFAPAFLDAQTPPILRGTVERMPGYQPTQGVSVSGSNAQAFTSLSDGSYELEFVGKKAGEKARLRVVADGYEIVNRNELRIHNIPRDPDDEFVIVVCSLGERDIYAPEHYRITIERNIDRSFAREVAKGVNEEEIGRLIQQRDRAKANAEQMGRALARLDLSDFSERSQRAYAFLAAGELDSLQALLPDSLMESEWQRIQRRKAEAETAEREWVQQAISKARAYVQSFDVARAQKWYEKAVEADSANFALLWEFAYYLDEQNQTTRTLALYQRALPLAPNLVDSVAILNNRGLAYRARNQYDLALADYHRALAILDTLAAREPDRFLPDLAMSLNNRGGVYYDRSQYDLALADYDRALAIRDTLAAQEPDRFLPDLAMSLNNRGGVYYDRNQYDLALADYDRALAIRDTLAAQEPDRFLPDLAMSLNNRGIAYRDRNEYDLALSDYDRALAIYDTLATQEPARFLPELAMSLNNRGNTYRDRTQYDLALADYDRAVAIRETLAAKEPARFLPDLAMSFNNRGVLLSSLKRFEAAFRDLRRALEIKDTLVLANPDVYCADRVQTLINLFIVHLEHAQEGGDEQAVEKILYYLNEAGRSVRACPQTPQTAEFVQIIQKSKLLISIPDDYFIDQRDYTDLTTTKIKIRLLRRIVSKMEAEGARDSAVVKMYVILAKYHVYAQEFRQAEAVSLIALTFDDAFNVLGNKTLTLALLYQGKFKRAKALYARFKGQPYPQRPSASWTDIFREDLNALEAEGITHPDVARIRAFLAE